MTLLLWFGYFFCDYNSGVGMLPLKREDVFYYYIILGIVTGVIVIIFFLIYLLVKFGCLLFKKKIGAKDDDVKGKNGR